jgi:UDP-N-acetylmuramate dehydrogenase
MSPPAGVAAEFPMSRLTTVGTGGPARWFARPEHREQLEQVLRWAGEAGLPLAVVGLGSNLLVSDDGFDGLVLKLAGDLAGVQRAGDSVTCGGGTPLAVVVKRCPVWGLTGVEFGCAIPGTVGGAVRMNAGAYGSELRDILTEATVVGAGGARRGGADELDMRYRHSNVAAGEVVAEVVLGLQPADPAVIRDTIREMQQRRRDAQPAKVRTFGSVWKNPGAGVTAGRLLEQCGLKGFAVGGARISPVHANFIENTGGARSADVLDLMVEARRRVLDQYGVELEHEVQMLGEIALPASDQSPS